MTECGGVSPNSAVGDASPNGSTGATSPGSPANSVGRRFDGSAKRNTPAGGTNGALFGVHKKTGSFGGNKVADPIWIDDDCEVDDEFCFSDDACTPDVHVSKHKRKRGGGKISYEEEDEEELSGSFRKREIEIERKMVNRLWDKPTTSADLLHITSHAPVNRTGKAAPKETVNTTANKRNTHNKKQQKKKKRNKNGFTQR